MPHERLSEQSIQYHRGRPWRCAVAPASTSTIGRGVQMWDLLKKTDIERAKQELRLRRVQTLRKHAEESQNLDTERVELEILNNLLDIFALKFMKPKILSQKPIPAPVVHEPAPAVHEKVSTKPVEGDHARTPRCPGL